MSVRVAAYRCRCKVHRWTRRAVIGLRIRWFRVLSSNRGAFEGACVVSPVLAEGAGQILAAGAQLGFVPSPGAFDGCIHLEARAGSEIRISPGCVVNNSCVMIAEGPGIRLGRDALLGPEVMIVDSDFHNLDPLLRTTGSPAMGAVEIGDNVFLGARSIVLKGVRIGKNTVVGANSVVVRDLPPDVTAAGNPGTPIGPVPSGQNLAQ